MFFLMISCFLLCWTPYAIVSMVEAFGRQSMVSPTVAIIPSFFAKSSTAYNPLIYVFMSRKVSCFGAQIEKCISKLCSKALDFGACFISILLMDAALAKTSLLSLQFHFQLSEHSLPVMLAHNLEYCLYTLVAQAVTSLVSFSMKKAFRLYNPEKF